MGALSFPDDRGPAVGKSMAQGYDNLDSVAACGCGAQVRRKGGRREHLLDFVYTRYQVP
ncbi:hypothetical protein GCM10027456_30640 [Kineosporia babensis]